MRNRRALLDEAAGPIAAGGTTGWTEWPHPSDDQNQIGANPNNILAHRALVPQPPVVPESIARHLGEWHCLTGAVRDLQRAAFGLNAMARLGLSPLEALLAFRALTESDAVAAIASHLGLATAARPLTMAPAGAGSAANEGIALALEGGDPVVAVDTLRYSPDSIRNLVAESGWPPQRVVLATRVQWCEALTLARPKEMLHQAVTALQRRAPQLAANTPTPVRQLVRLSLLPGLIIGSAIVAPDGMLAVLAAFLTLPFLCVAGLRIAALREALRPQRAEAASPITTTGGPDDGDLPLYSVLVPLYREANVLPGLVDALSQIDYPDDKLDIILILESDDAETREAAGLIELSPCMRVVLVPPGEPRTKPRALNYALQIARGEFVCVFDAEDIPDPDQLLRAAAMFRRASPALACVQGRLNIDNADGGWLEKQFTIEYTALFDAVLPTLHNLNIPIPLGGTSNHFPTALLRALGAWDPYNVTEDADLGIRLARAGLETRILASTTWEEAPARLGSWYRQRTRWLKGWMQTYLVHTRRPLRLKVDLGFWRYCGFLILMAGLMLSVLLHPLFYLLLLAEMATGQVFGGGQTTLGLVLLGLAAFNLLIGFGSSILLGAVAVRRRGRRDLAWHAATMPLYWLLISAAGYRAIMQLFTRPHHWEKTDHGQSARAGSHRRDSRGAADAVET